MSLSCVLLCILLQVYTILADGHMPQMFFLLLLPRQRPINSGKKTIKSGIFDHRYLQQKK